MITPKLQKIVVDLTVTGELPKELKGDVNVTVDLNATIASLIANAQRWAASFPDQALVSGLECLESIPGDLDATVVDEQLRALMTILLANVFRVECDRRLQNSGAAERK